MSFSFDISIPRGHWVDTESEARRWLAKFLETHLKNEGLGLDTETTGLHKFNDRIIVWSLSDGEDRICLPASMIPVFKEPLLENPDINFDFTRAKFDAHMFANMGVDLSKAGDWRSTDVQSFLLNENNTGRHGLKECIVDHFGRATPTFEQTFGKVPPKKINKLTGQNMNKTVGDILREAYTDPGPPPAKALEYSTEATVAAIDAQITLWQAKLDLFRRAVDYASLDAYNSTSLRAYFDQRLEDEKISSNYTLCDYYYAVEVPFTKLLWKLERRGITADKGYLEALRGPMEEKMVSINWEFNREAGREINLDSTNDVRWFFIEHLGRETHKMTKGGAKGIKLPSVDADTLDTWAGQGDVWARRMLEYRTYSKIHGTYIVGLDKWIDPFFRIHTSLNQTGAVTMRLSSSEPNLQNIPRPGDDIFRIRDAFIPGEGMVFIVADYEQLEMRLMAHFSRDQKMIDAIKNGIDLHCLTVAEMYGIPYDDVIAAKKADKDVKSGKRKEPLTAREEELLFFRQAAKATGFGIIYGIGGPHLAANLTKELKRLVTQEEGIQLIHKWYGVFPGVKAYIDYTKDFLLKKGFVQTLVGRYRRFGDLRGMSKMDASRAERQSVNSIIQGTASDIAKRAMLNAEADPELRSLGAQMLLQIHDELIFECPDRPEVVKAVKARVKFIMENPFSEPLQVPLPAEVGSGYTWSTAK
jgi:DNA polymerase-1